MQKKEIAKVSVLDGWTTPHWIVLSGSSGKWVKSSIKLAKIRKNSEQNEFLIFYLIVLSKNNLQFSVEFGNSLVFRGKVRT